MKTKPKVGDVVIAVGYPSGRHRSEAVTEEKVERVGRLYFYTGNGYRERKYSIDGWRESVECGACGYAFASYREMDESTEADKICGEMCRVFRLCRNAHGISIENLRKIKALATAEPKG